MEQRATALIRKILLLAYSMKWIECERKNLGSISCTVLEQVQQNVLEEIAYLKQVMKRNGIRVIKRELQPHTVWVKYKENQNMNEATYPKSILIADVESHMKLMLQEFVATRVQI